MGYSFSPHLKKRFSKGAAQKQPGQRRKRFKDNFLCLLKLTRKIILVDFNFPAKYLPNHIYFVILRAKLKQAVKNFVPDNYKRYKKIAAAFYCGNVNCEDSVKDKLNGVKAICIPFSKEKKRGSCVYCGKDSKEVAYFAKSY